MPRIQDIDHKLDSGQDGADGAIPIASRRQPANSLTPPQARETRVMLNYESGKTPKPRMIIQPSARFQCFRRAVLAAAIGLTVVLGGWIGVRVAEFVVAGRWVAVAMALGLGIAAIDVVTGVVHWACDRFGNAETPFLGELLIRAFREHHVDATKMVEHDWIETNGEPCFSSAIALSALAAFAPDSQSGLGAALVTAVWTMAVVGAGANQVHKWAHMPSAPPLARCLQRAGLALRPGEHACHHRPPYDSGYCISTGWMNPLLDRLQIWSWLERLIRRAA